MANVKQESASSSAAADGSAKLFRIVMLGQGGSGKSNIADRFVKNTYTDPHKITLGVEFQTKLMTLANGKKVKFEIWDTSGQERYSVLAPMYYRGANAAIVVYDLTDQHSYGRAKRWIVELQQNALSDTVIVLVGNKLDLETHRTIDSLDAEVYADDNNLSFAEVSAKTGVGIQELFEALAHRLCNEHSSGGSSSVNYSSSAATIKLRSLSDRSTSSLEGSRSCTCGSVVVSLNDSKAT